MKRIFVTISIVFSMFAASTVFAEEFTFSDDILDKVSELKTQAEAKKEMPTAIDGIKMIEVNEAYALWQAKKAVFIDTRPKVQYDTEHIPDAIWLNSDQLLENPALAKSLDKSKEYITYCSGVNCRLAPSGALELRALGYEKVRFFRGGIPAWKSKGYPVK